jgi:hypothetical protein
MYGLGATDSMLAVTDPSTGVRKVRAGVLLSEVDEGVALTRWSPMPGVRIDTALAGGAPWHVRVHRIDTDRELLLTETGFALPWEPEGFAPPPLDDPERGVATMTSGAGASTIVDRPGGEVTRRAELAALSPNANVMHPHTVVPALAVTIPAGCHQLACAVGASHESEHVTAALAPAVEQALYERLDAFAARQAPS